MSQESSVFWPVMFAIKEANTALSYNTYTIHWRSADIDVRPDEANVGFRVAFLVNY